MSVRALGIESAARLIECVDEVMLAARDLLEVTERHRTGGYFCVTDAGGVILHLWAVGSVPRDKAQRYGVLAIEKAKRLVTYHEHVSSFQSRNPKKDQWGGAVVVSYREHPLGTQPYTGDIYSFSGFAPDFLDEAIVLAVAVRTEVVTLESAQEIARGSKNEYFQRLHDCLR